MNFQGALTLLKDGKKLRRKAWQFFAFVRIWGPHLEIVDTTSADLWRPTADDLFANDWECPTEPEAVQLAGLTGTLSFHNGYFQWKDPSGATTVNVRDLGEALSFAKRR